MRSQSAYLVVMMAMMGCFALFSFPERALVLCPGNVAVALGLGLAGLALALSWSSALPLGLFSAGLTAVMGLLQAGKVLPRQIRLPGSPIIWVVIGLYIAFRLVINSQRQKRLRDQPVTPTQDEDAAG